MDTNIQSFEVLVMKDNAGSYGGAGCTKRLECGRHQIIGEEVITTTDQHGPCNEYIPAGSSFPKGTVILYGIPVTVIKDLKMGLIYVRTASYNTGMDTCNDCCIEA
jgi:hypothetical protein